MPAKSGDAKYSVLFILIILLTIFISNIFTSGMTIEHINRNIDKKINVKDVLTESIVKTIFSTLLFILLGLLFITLIPITTGDLEITIDKTEKTKDNELTSFLPIRADILPYIKNIIKNYKHLHVENIDKFEDLPVNMRNAIRSMFIECSDIRIIADYAVKSRGYNSSFGKIEWNGNVLFVKNNYYMYPYESVNILRLYLKYLCDKHFITHEYDTINQLFNFSFEKNKGSVEIK